MLYKSFGITVKELLELDILENAKVLAGERGLNRRITKVNVMEVPDILDWVGDGELLLTTAFSIKDNLMKLNDLILQLHKKGIPGLGIKTKRFIGEIPKEILKTADELEFPIIEIPHDISYSEILMPTLTEIVNSQTNMLLKIDDLHEKLMNIMLVGGSLNEIAEALYGVIGNSLAIKENVFDSRIIFSKEDIKGDIEKIISEETFYFNYGDNSYEDRSLNRIETDNINGKNIKRIMIHICTKERNYGWIYLWEDIKELSPAELSMVESSTSIIALDLVKRLSIFEIESKHKIEFFDDLFSKDENRQRKALERTTFFGLDDKLSYTVIIIAIKNIDKLIKFTPNNTDFLHQLNGKILSIVQRLARFREENIIYGSKSDKLIVLFGSNCNKDINTVKKNVMEFSEEIFKYAKKESIKDNIAIGIGRNYRKLSELWQSYREADRSAKNLKGNVNGVPISYDELGIFRILDYEEVQPEIMQFYKETLEPLVIYDKEKGTDLVETLKKYFQCEGNIKKVSDEMFAHYNTIVYRMQRIKEITKIDFEDYDDRLNVQISLKIAEMLRKE